jgi:hypothetical protein
MLTSNEPPWHAPEFVDSAASYPLCCGREFPAQRTSEEVHHVGPLPEPGRWDLVMGKTRGTGGPIRKRECEPHPEAIVSRNLELHRELSSFIALGIQIPSLPTISRFRRPTNVGKEE